MRTRHGSLVSLFAVVVFLLLSGCGGGPGSGGASKPADVGCEVGRRIVAACKYDKQITVGPVTSDRRLNVSLGTGECLGIGPFMPGKTMDGIRGCHTRTGSVIKYNFDGTVLAISYPKGKLIIEYRNGAWVRTQ